MSRTLPIDVIVLGVRIKKQSGVTTKAERDDLVAMLRTLPKQGHLEIVRGIQAGRWSLLEVYAHYVAGTLAQLYGPQDDQQLDPVVDGWLDRALCADGTRDNRRDAFKALRALERRTLFLRDLPELLKTYRARCEEVKHPRTFNIARTAVQAFLRDTLGKRKPLTLAVADVPKLAERKQGRAGLVLPEAVAIRDQLPHDAALAWWSMVLTGMGPKEFFVDGFDVLADRVLIHGAKTEGRERAVPLIDTPVRPALTKDGYTSALRRLSGRRLRESLTAQLDRKPTPQELTAAAQAKGAQPWKVTPYQARKTFARWMEEARIPRTRRNRYRGHGTQDIGDNYERYEVDGYLRDDAKAMREYLLSVLPPRGLQIVS